MKETRNLSYDEYQLTFEAPMRDVAATAEPLLDIWPYVEAIPNADLAGFELLDGIVQYVYQHPKDEYLHVLISTENRDVFLVIIINLHSEKIHGHYLLNLLEIYAISPEAE